MSSVSTHIVIYATGLGITPVKAAAISVFCRFNAHNQLVSEVDVADRFGKRAVIIAGFALQAVALFGFMAARELWQLYLCALVFGFGRGTATAPMPLLMADIFGLKAFGVIQGATFSWSILGSISGPILTGLIFDVSGSYFYAFMICAVMTIMGVMMTSLIRTGLKKQASV